MGWMASLERPSCSELPVAAGESGTSRVPQVGPFRVVRAHESGVRVPAPTSQDGLSSDEKDAS